MKTRSRNLTEGNIVLQLLSVAFPIIMAQLLQNLYNSVDSLIVGNFIGTVAVAAITASSEISNLIITFFVGLSTGSGVVFASYFGAKDHEKLHKAIHTAITLAVIMGMVMAFVGVVMAPVLLRMVKCPEDVFSSAVTYLRVYLIGVFFTSLYNVATGVLRAVGDTKTPLYYLVIACLANIILDLLFVVVIPMGIFGVALATIMAQSLTVVLIYGKMMRSKDVYQLRISDLHVDPDIMLKVLKLGLPAAIQSCMVSFSNLFVQRYVNLFGSSAMAGAGVAGKINKYVSEVAKSLGTAATIFVSQNLGAGKTRRAYTGVLYAFLLSVAGITLMGIPVYYNAPALIGLFLKETVAVQNGVLMVCTIVPWYCLQSAYQVLVNSIRGFGYSLTAMVTMMSGLIVCRQIFLAIAMPLTNSVHTVFISYPVGWGSTAVVSFLVFWFFVQKKVPLER